jgi:hypothetical protein
VFDLLYDRDAAKPIEQINQTAVIDGHIVRSAE